MVIPNIWKSAEAPLGRHACLPIKGISQFPVGIKGLREASSAESYSINRLFIDFSVLIFEVLFRKTSGWTSKVSNTSSISNSFPPVGRDFLA
ncbi:hypothetical protein K7X08_032024 [Anisodus acutangulus]|uniref:Uncharacterized protein n=1 Tax=Anisodus acutangulus TaxID=402998 RepID=A0A9Q1MSU5_9SOLA|nr:hypothetical protein K7X08_032024 [Anisodus acutangulus]